MHKPPFQFFTVSCYYLNRIQTRPPLISDSSLSTIAFYVRSAAMDDMTYTY
ncbi:hypothetical protein HHX47_DHR6000554 [Lentinula edodes]|nr:hypothetical protein HHX47_DHR6000554 [Lentinula edodes]